MTAPHPQSRVGGTDYRGNLPWPPRRAGCSGDCQQGRTACDCLDQREGLQRIDTLRRADCDPALPLGQDEPSEPNRSHEMLAGLLLAVLIVAAVAAAVLLVRWAAGADEPVRVPVVTTRGMA